MAHSRIEQLRDVFRLFVATSNIGGKLYTRSITSHSRGVSTCPVWRRQDQQVLAKPAATPQTSYGQPFNVTHPHLIKHGEVTPGLSVDEFASRRHRLVESLSEHTHTSAARHHVVVVPGARMRYLSEDIPHPFRQDTDLLYLSGCQEPDAVLVLHSRPFAPGTHTSALFVQRNTAHRQLWEGGGTGPEAAPGLLGVDRAHGLPELPRYLEGLASDLAGPPAVVWYDFAREPHSPLTGTVRDLAGALRGAILESPRRAIQQLRVIKSPAEQRLMRRSARCASAAIADTMAASLPGITEHQLYARVEFGARMRGAERLAYPPVVAGGARTNIIHYTHNNRTVEDGCLVLMDAGSELHGYNSDITRTWPVNGRFSREQRLLYQTLLDVQQALIATVSRSRPSLDDLYRHMLSMLAERLTDLGLVGGNRERPQLVRSVQRFCPHHVGHYLGMDVHDTCLVPKNIPLQPGMVLTIEPGLYIASDDCSVPEELRGLGMRIEDDVLITEDGCEVLSERCPKTVDELESIIGTRPDRTFEPCD